MNRELFGVGGDAIIFDQDNRVLLLKRSDNDPYQPGSWDLPGGVLEKNESPYDSLKREVKEETNLEIDILYPFEVYKFSRNLFGIPVISIKYVAQYKSGEVKLSSEHKYFEWFKISQLPNDVDAKIIAWIKKGADLLNVAARRTKTFSNSNQLPDQPD